MHSHTEEPEASEPQPAHRQASGSLGDLAAGAARRGGQRPFLTFYDDATGERTELGHATLDNWVSKAANLLAGEFGLAPPAAVELRTGTHWTTLVLLLAAWRCGLTVRYGAGEPGAAVADLTVIDEHDAGQVADPERTLVVGSGPGARLTGDAGAAHPFAEEVLACADEFDDAGVEVGPETPALLLPDRVPRTHGDLLARAAASREALGLGGGERLLLTHPLEELDGIVAVLAAMAAGASVVLVAGGAPAALDARARAERCDVVLGPGAASGGTGT